MPKLPKLQKYREDAILKEIADYVDSTYARHYVGDDDIQAIDLAASDGSLRDFAKVSIIKYAFRYGKKEGFNRKDLLKIVHYAMFLMWDQERSANKQ